MIKKFRKKPVVIEAVQWDGSAESATEIEELKSNNNTEIIGLEDGLRLLIPTLEGDMIADLYDWVIKGVQGEIYPCKPDIFEQTYEEV